MDPQLYETCRQIIYVAPLASVSASGDPAYGPAVQMRARVEDDQENADNAAGTQTVTRKRIMTADRINKTDRVWLPGDAPSNNSLGRTPMKVQELPDENGVVDHWETIL